jgi:N-acetylglucosamine kinase-like BadF-type ATPase
MFLGVDGGGTKTCFALISSEGELLARHDRGGSYYLDSSLTQVQSLLECGVHATLQAAGARIEDVRFAFFGLPALGEDSRVDPVLERLPDKFLSPLRYRSGNDMVCGWAGSLAGADGVNTIAGTGAMAYGVWQGREARAGGWGELYSDEGSAYWIAVQALNAFTRMSDGRIAMTPLHEVLRNHLELQRDLDLGAIVLGTWQGKRNLIAQLSRVVYEAALQGDAVAIDILHRAGVELAATVHAVCRQLQVPPSAPLPVSWSGSVFKSGQLVLRSFEAALKAHHPLYELRAPALAPVLGAALHAARLAGTPLSGPALNRLRASAK